MNGEVGINAFLDEIRYNPEEYLTLPHLGKEPAGQQNRGRMVLKVYPLRDMPLNLITLTAYDSHGRKSTRAFDLSDFLQVVSLLERGVEATSKHLEDVYDTEPTILERTVLGFQPSASVKDFLNEMQAHRMLFVRDKVLGSFLKAVTLKNARSGLFHSDIPLYIEYQ